MAEEKEPLVEGQSDTGQAAGVEVEEKKTAEAVLAEAKVDYEDKYREIQAEKDRLQQQYDSLSKEYDAVRPYVNFPADSTAQQAQADENDELPITRGELKQYISNLERRHIAERTADKFLTENPDLRPYEKLLVQFLGESKNLQEAAKKTRAFLEDERKKGEEIAANKEKERTKAAAAASGFGSAGSTSPKKIEEEKVETPESYVEERKRQAQARRVAI